MVYGDRLAYMESPVNWRAMTFGQRVRETREYRELSQEALAVAVGIKQSSMSAIERGDTKIDDIKARTLLGLAKALRVSIDFLTVGDGNPDDAKAITNDLDVTPREELILEFVQKLSVEQQEELLPPLRAAVEANDFAKGQLKGSLKIVKNARIEAKYGLPGPSRLKVKRR